MRNWVVFALLTAAIVFLFSVLGARQVSAHSIGPCLESTKFYAVMENAGYEAGFIGLLTSQPCANNGDGRLRW